MLILQALEHVVFDVLAFEPHICGALICDLTVKWLFWVLLGANTPLFIINVIENCPKITFLESEGLVRMPFRNPVWLRLWISLLLWFVWHRK